MNHREVMRSRIRAALGKPQRAYHENHEPPHCPTCGCGQAKPDDDARDADELLRRYEERTKALPCQHEIPERGCSTYNWQMGAIRDLRSILAAMRGEVGS